jgi:D-lactate dehydrogenase
MKTIKIAFFDSKQYDMDSFDRTNADFHYEFKYYKEHISLDTLPLTKGADVVCLFVNDNVTGDMIRVMKENGVKLIALRCAGYNNIDLQAAYENIPVVRVPAYSPYAVAEHAVALILTLNRKTHKAYIRTRDNNFTINGFTGFDLFGKTAGIIGTGRIGFILINILKGFGMNVLAFDAFPNQAEAQSRGFTYTDLDTIYRESDIISLHCPLTKETEYLINEKSIAKMKDDVMIINTSRGKLIDTKALIRGLKTAKIGYAGLDVYEEEHEYFFEDFSTEILNDDILARLLTFPNVLITSHQAFFTKEALANIAGTTLDNIRRFFENGDLPNEICYRCGQPTGKCKKTETGRCFSDKAIHN